MSDDVYVIFGDGLPADAFGPLITNFALLGSSIVSVGDERITFAPREFQLHQNYPNPFNPYTIISWQLAARSHVSLKVYNIIGQQITELINEYQSAGKHSISFNAFSENLFYQAEYFFINLVAVNLSRFEKWFC